jgi:hypothetical protein
MKIRLLFGALVILATGTVFGYRQDSVIAPRLAEADEAAMLAATLQITMFEHAPQAGGTKRGSRGLGTLVAHGNDILIVTHDHWVHRTPKLHEVELRDARGELLLTLEAAAFHTLVVYSDGGTMILRAPGGLRGLVPVELGAANAATETVWVMRRALAPDRNTLEIAAATVVLPKDVAFPARMQLQSLDGSGVLPGDSGGGVWVNGRLVGNVWAGGVQTTPGFWSRLLGDGQPQATGQLIAAWQPLGEQLDLLPLSDSDGPSGGLGYERGLAEN